MQSKYRQTWSPNSGPPPNAALLLQSTVPQESQPHIRSYSLLRFLGRERRVERKWPYLCTQGWVVWENAMTEQPAGRGTRMAGSGEARKTGAEQRSHPSGRRAEGWTSVCCITALPTGGHFIHSFGTLDRCQRLGLQGGRWQTNPALKLLHFVESEEEGSYLQGAHQM